MMANVMPDTRDIITDAINYVNRKTLDRNYVSAAFHMIIITLISMSLVDLNWFTINGGDCIRFITLSDFFTFGYSASDVQNPEYQCITNTTTNLMRIIILLCFMAMIFSLVGFFLEILGPKTKISSILRKYSVPSICTVVWIMIIISICYYVVILLEDSLINLYPKEEISISYGSGFYLIAGTGGIALLGTFCNLILTHSSSNNRCRLEEGCLVENDALDIFHTPPPPPPYNVPPPPYTP